MSDIDPELPDWLTEAVLSQEPPTEAVDLVKDAFTWRTIDAELMELTYDSVLDEAGVRDASARRTMEFTAGDVSVVIEIDGRTIRCRFSGLVAHVRAVTIDEAEQSLQLREDSYVAVDVARGTYVIQFEVDRRRYATPSVAVA